MFDYMNFGLGVKRHRKMSNLSLRQLADRIGISEDYLQRIESGKAKPSVKLLTTICNTLNVRVSDCLVNTIEHGKLQQMQFTSKMACFSPHEEILISNIIDYVKEIDCEG